MMLHLNRTFLQRHGYAVSYPGRDGIPSGKLGLRLPSPRHAGMDLKRWKASVTAELQRYVTAQSKALILSEENIPGRMMHFQKGQFYPNSGARFDTLRSGIGQAPVSILIVVRSYADLFVSAYRKRAEDNLVDPFEVSRNNLLNIGRGWPELLQEMQRVLKPDQMTVLEYAARGKSTDLLRRLVPGLENLPLIEPARTVNLSATDAALLALQARYARGETLDRDTWQNVIREHEHEKTSLGFAEFRPKHLSLLNKKYRQDLGRLQEIQGVRFIG